MYLSKLEIIGFKSFAQKVGLAFDSGISAIVGPNGCGKTNIVDAIRWVLGEQRYSALRSDKMEDVIFNGTKSRKALGMAEASLVIENTKGILPSEYTQVTIGRRVYRSGESEYLLNKTPCRLKDILDLFMDTGMGADAYSVIELKMIEVILSDKTDERRRLFEEAAGVTKYKHRRKAAYRKLESVQADLVRVNDIVAEVQKAVNSLERQARRAEQYNELRTRLRTLEIDLMEREYAQLLSRIEPLSARVESLTHDKSRVDVDLTRGEQELEQLRTQLLQCDKRVAEAQRDVSLHREKINRVEQGTMVAAERIRAHRANQQRFERETVSLGQQREQLELSRTSLGQHIAELNVQESRTTEELKQKQEALSAFEAGLDRKQKELQSLNEQTIALVHEISKRQTERDRKNGQVENLKGRSAHASEEIEAYNKEIERLNGSIASMTAQDRQLRRSFNEAEMQYYAAEATKKELLAKIDDLQRKEMDVRAEVERQRSRIGFLKGLIESREGLSEGARYLAATEKWKPSRNVTVADAINAEERYRTAIEAALGDFAGLVVVDTSADAEAGIVLLKEDQKGKATFVCLDRMPEIQSRFSLPQIPGVLGWAADLAGFDSVYSPLFRYVLDRVLVVDNAETARRVSAELSGIRCVTLEGEVVTGVGITRGGSRRVDEGGMIGKHEQIEELTRGCEANEKVLEGLTSSREQALSEHDAIDLKKLSDAVKGIEKEMNGVEMRIAQLEFEKKRASDVIAQNSEDVEELAGESAALLEELARDLPELEALKARQSEVERMTGAVSQELQSLEEEWNGLSKGVTDLGIAVVQVRGELQNAHNDLERAEQTISDTLEAVEKRKADILTTEQEIASTDLYINENSLVLESLHQELAGVEARRTREEEAASGVREEIHRIELAIKDQRRTHDDSMRLMHEHQLQLQDLRAKAEHILSRAQEEFEFTIELKTYPPDEFVDFAKLREEIPTLRDKIKSLGNINFAAFEEYTAEKQRFEFLSTQRQDLLEAEKTLLETIEQINTTAQAKFLETFAQIRTNFIETFKSLFDPGDECDLKLEENVDPLEAGIEIVAKPRGKRPTSIDLLSGGEKTLTAIALLFAIYLVKPSPFCILDEVDAPLDDANVDRFTRILRKFSNNTQFIVVTHNKRTMEAASALYGVTMEEEGISKIVTVRFNQGAQVASAALATG
jgi:chromosome segregation protein